MRTRSPGTDALWHLPSLSDHGISFQQPDEDNSIEVNKLELRSLGNTWTLKRLTWVRGRGQPIGSCKDLHIFFFLVRKWEAGLSLESMCLTESENLYLPVTILNLEI